MTVSTRPYWWWGGSGLPNGTAPYSTCSPGCTSLSSYVRQRWGGASLGCYAARPVRGGTTLSDHAFGAAFDASFPTHQAMDEVNQFLIDYSKELGVNSIIDERPPVKMWYVGKGWHSISSGSSGMWLHVSITPEFFGNGSSIPIKLEKVLPPTPPPPGGLIVTPEDLKILQQMEKNLVAAFGPAVWQQLLTSTAGTQVDAARWLTGAGDNAFLSQQILAGLSVEGLTAAIVAAVNEALADVGSGLEIPVEAIATATVAKLKASITV